MTTRTEAVKAYLLDLQDRICSALETFETDTRFIEDAWTRPAGGGGRTRVIENGTVIEKGGVNFSHVFGSGLPPSASAHRPELAGRGFEALGVSLVIHPHNPHVPTSHANVRFFIAEKKVKSRCGGLAAASTSRPITPTKKTASTGTAWPNRPVRPFGADVYARYKAWCDTYFYIKHRNEPRASAGCSSMT